MDKKQRQQMAADLIITIITTLIILLIWYVAETPDWKRQALFKRAMDKVNPHVPSGLSPGEMMDLAAFRIEVSKYSHGGADHNGL